MITGASSGIGAALARLLASHGDCVVLGARRETALKDVAADLAGAALIVPADVTVRADVERIRDTAIGRFGHVDAWVNNAGRGITRSVLELTDDDVDTMVAINVKSALYGMQAIVPHFIERRHGHLLNVSSFLSKVPAAPFRSAYSGAKAMLNSLTASARADLSAYPGIRVTLILPGIVTTEFQRNALGGVPVRTAAPSVARAQTADEVAATIAAALDLPAAEVYTNPALHAVAVRYIQDVDAFERSRE